MFDDYFDRLFGRTEAEITDDEIESDYRVSRWKLGDHSRRPTIGSDDLRTQADMVDGVDDDLREIFQEAAARVGDIELHDFECSVCGQTHGHDDRKHDIRQSFNVLPEFAEDMEFDPKCHCGVNELAVLVSSIEEIERPVFTDQDDLDDRELEKRVKAIRSAASNARVTNAVETRLESIKSEMDDYIAEDDDEPESPTGRLRSAREDPFDPY